MATHSSTVAWKNPMDRGAWQATVHRVTKSQTGLKRLSMHAHWTICQVNFYLFHIYFDLEILDPEIKTEESLK